MKKLLTLLFVLWALPAFAQQELDALNIRVGPAGTTCFWSTGTGAPTGGATCDFYTDRTSGDLYRNLASGGWTKVGGGTVTSVGLALPAEFTVTNSPVTGAGTLTGAWASQTANKAFVSPDGAPGTPTFRALVNNDLPTVDVSHGGTGLTTLTAHNVYVGNGTSAPAAIAGCTVGVLHWASSGVDPTCNTNPTVTSVVANSTATLGATNPSPYIRHDLPLVEQRALGATRYVGGWWVEPSGTGVYFDSYDTTGNVQLPFVFRGSSLNVKSPLVVTGQVTAGGNILPDVAYTRTVGSLSNKFSAGHFGELWAETLVAQNTLSTIGGRILVTPTNILEADVGATDASITVQYNNFASGDYVLLQANGSTEWMKITSSAVTSGANYIYSVTRDLDGTGANAWSEGGAVAQMTNFIDLYSVSGVLSGTGPTIVGNVRTSSATYNAIEPRWAIGNCNGLYGYATDIMCTAMGSPSGAWVKIDPTNGVRLGYNATTNVQIEADGDATLGAWTLTTAAFLKDTGMAATSAGMAPTDFPFYAGATYANRATAPFRVTPAGALTATSGAIGGWTLGATSLTSGSGATTVGVDSGGTNPAFYAGSATPASAPFRVTNAGALTSTSGAIGGWTLGATSLMAGSGATTVGVDSGGTNPAFYAGSATPGSAPFRVTNAGALTATSGAIGGWTLSATSLTSNSSTVGLDSGGSNPVFYAGSDTPASAPFKVTTAGLLTARDATLVGTVTASSSISTGTGGNYLCINTTTYEVLRGNGSTCTASAARFKERVTSLTYGLAEVRQFRPVSYSYTSTSNMGPGRRIGLIADEVALVTPEPVTYRKGEVFGLDYEQLIPVLIRAIQDLDHEVTSLKARIQ